MLSWTAVVRGAAMHGIEKKSLKHAVRTSSSEHNYAIAFDRVQAKGADSKDRQHEHPVTGKTMGTDLLTWMIREGDLILLDRNEGPTTLLEFYFWPTDSREFSVPVYQYIGKRN